MHTYVYAYKIHAHIHTYMHTRFIMKHLSVNIRKLIFMIVSTQNYNNESPLVNVSYRRLIVMTADQLMIRNIHINACKQYVIPIRSYPHYSARHDTRSGSYRSPTPWKLIPVKNVTSQLSHRDLI